jgi:hypothetical protein
MAYFSGQGRVYLAQRDANGNPLDLRWVGNVPDLKISLAVEKSEHKESHSGQRLTDFELITGKSGELTCTLEKYDQANLELVAYGVSQSVAAGSVDDEPLAVGMVAGSLRLLAHQFVSAVTVEDSTPGTPLVLPTTQYKVHGPQGAVELLDGTTGGPYVQPFKVSYTRGAAKQLAMFRAAQPQLWLRFDGVNTADGNKRVIVDLYKVSIDPTKDLSLIGTELQKFELVGMVLADTEKDADGELGQFGRIIQAD